MTDPPIISEETLLVFAFSTIFFAVTQVGIWSVVQWVLFLALVIGGSVVGVLLITRN